MGSLNRAFALVQRVTGTDEWDAIDRRSTEDLLVYLALDRSYRRPPMPALPSRLRQDVRAFFGISANGCRRADDLLFRAGDAWAFDDACLRRSGGLRLQPRSPSPPAPGGVD